MTIVPHLLLTTAGIQLLGLEGKDIVLAYTFGYGIDLVDHPIKLPLYLGTYVPALFFISHFALDYMVSYEKRPFYPFSTYSTEGVLQGISDTKKEIWTCAICAVMIAAFIISQHKIF